MTGRGRGLPGGRPAPRTSGPTTSRGVKMQLVRNPRRTVGALALGLAAAGVAVGSGADFSARSANPSNTFTAGSLSIDNSREGAAVFSPDDLRPGAPARTGT